MKKIDDKEEMLLTEDGTVVFTRPKYYVGSTSSVWASELMRLRYEELIFFEVKKALQEYEQRLQEYFNIA